MTKEEIFRDFSEWSPAHAEMVTSYRMWGENSIAIWLLNGQIYKCKQYAPHRFVMQPLTEADVKKKYNYK